MFFYVNDISSGFHISNKYSHVKISELEEFVLPILFVMCISCFVKLTSSSLEKNIIELGFRNRTRFAHNRVIKLIKSK